MEHSSTSSTSGQRLRKLLQRADAVRSRDLVTAGISRSQLSRMVVTGHLQRVGRGLYALPGHQGGEHSALVAVARRAPAAVFCLLTALRVHALTTQAPFEVWIAIGNKDHAPRMDYPPLRVVRFSGPSLAEGVELLTVDGTAIHVTSVAKTVADCFKFRNKIGLDLALEALREARRARKLSMDELWRCAQVDRVTAVIRPYLEAISREVADHQHDLAGRDCGTNIAARAAAGSASAIRAGFRIAAAAE